MMYIIKLIFRTTLDVMSHNPVKTTYLSLMLFSYFMMGYVDRYHEVHKVINNVIIEKNEDGSVEEYLYITKEGNDYEIFKKSKPIKINDDNEYVYNEISVSYFPFYILSWIFLILLIISFLVSLTEDYQNNYNYPDDSSWQFEVSYRKSRDRLLMKEIIIKEDINRTYYVLMGKILKVSTKMDEDISEYQLKSMVDKYVRYKNVLRDFEGTLSERRDIEIDVLLSRNK